MGVSLSISDKDTMIALIELIPISTEVKEIANPMTNKKVVGLHFRFRCCSIIVLAFFFFCSYDYTPFISLQSFFEKNSCHKQDILLAPQKHRSVDYFLQLVAAHTLNVCIIARVIVDAINLICALVRRA